MDEFQRLAIKIPNSVLVEGLSDTDSKEEVVDFLKQYGKITRSEIICETESEYDGQLIVEFSSGLSVTELHSILPYSLYSSEKKETFHISELSIVYVVHVEQSKTKSYLVELENIAKLSGIDFTEVLKTTMTQIGQSVTKLHSFSYVEDPIENPEDRAPLSELTMKEDLAFQNTIAPDPTFSRPGSKPQTTTRPKQSLNKEDIQPPEIQRYVVEHIMKTEESGLHLQRGFSGRLLRQHVN